MTKDDEKLVEDLTAHTKKISKMLSPLNEAAELRLYNHILLTQKLLMICRKNSDWGVDDNLIKSYMGALPMDDLTTLIYWDKSTLNEIDSELIRSHYQQT